MNDQALGILIIGGAVAGALYLGNGGSIAIPFMNNGGSINPNSDIVSTPQSDVGAIETGFTDAPSESLLSFSTISGSSTKKSSRRASGSLGTELVSNLPANQSYSPDLSYTPEANFMTDTGEAVYVPPPATTTTTKKKKKETEEKNYSSA